MLSDKQINEAAEQFMQLHGKECYRRLIEKWDHDSLPLAQQYFKAGLAMGFAEACRLINNSGEIGGGDGK